MPAGTHPYVIGQPNAGPALTAPFLLDRHVFTARPPQEWSGTATGILAPAWDLDVQVWDRQGRTAVEWAGAFPCDDPSVTLGGTNCVRSSQTIRGSSIPQISSGHCSGSGSMVGTGSTCQLVIPSMLRATDKSFQARSIV